MATLDFDVYDGKSFRDICKDVVDRSQSKKDQLDIMITETRSFIKDVNTAQAFIPRLKELIEVGIKNDEQIIKLAAVLQRLQSTQLETTGGDGGLLSDEEKEALRKNSMETLKEIKKEVDSSIVLPPTSSI